jgi:CPA2 family monovalent cation:H+ antiporter-2
VIRVVQDQRDARYNLLRGYFHGSDDNTAAEVDQERLHSVSLPLGARCLDKSLGELVLHAMGVRVVNLRRHGGKTLAPSDDTVLIEGDTVVLSGRPEALALAEHKLLKG